jgi:hypothetical protein
MDINVRYEYILKISGNKISWLRLTRIELLNKRNPPKFYA